MDLNPGLTDPRASFSNSDALIYVSPDVDDVRTLFKSHVHPFKTLC